ncbi:MAG: site-specific DNA-methyltransferase [Gallionellaceae bacterium]
MANSEQLKVLKQHFPNCFDKNGAFIPDKLQAIVEENGVKVSTEGYSLNWLGKSYARLLTNEAPRTLLKADAAHNAQPNNSNSQNLLIKGDNLEVLKHLKGAYSRQVKMIYIDPPYNTGSDGFVYDDDRQFTAEQLSHLAGIELEEASRVLDFTSSKSNSHSAWLTFMYPRLYIARELLRDDGVIFISIDDNEQAQLRILCDEVFGEENFAGQFPWRKRTAKSDVPFGVSQDFEWVICYAKSNTMLGNFIERRYYQTDDYPNDRWRLSDLTTQRSAEERPNSDFDMVDPKTSKPFPVNRKRCWGVTKDTFQDYYDKGKIVFPDDYTFLNITVPAFRVFESEDQKKSLKKYDSALPMKAVSTLLPKEVGMSETGNSEMVDMFGFKAFSFPKPTALIKYFIGLNTSKECVILDFFAGSGTTAHAVMQLNAEDGGNRQFICVQLPEATDVKSEAHKAGYPTIFDITHARITKAAVKIKAEYPDCQGDLGFKVFETVPLFDGYLDEPEELSATLEMFNGDALTEQDRFNLLLTWAAQDGISLTSELTPVELAGYIAYLGGEAGRLLYFIHPKLSLDVVVELLRRLDDDAKFAPKHLIVWGYGLDSKEQREMSEAIAHHNKSNRKGIELDLEVRF